MGKRFANVLVVSAVLILLFASAAPIAKSQTNRITAVVVTTPADLGSIGVGQAFQVSINLSGIGSGYGYSALLAFDADVLDVQPTSIEGFQGEGAARPGNSFPIPPGGTNTFFARNRVVFDDPARSGTSVNDLVEVAFTYLNPAEPVSNFTGTLLTVTFSVKQAGATTIELIDLRIIEKSAEGEAVDAQLAFDGDLTVAVNGGVQTVNVPKCNFNGFCDNALGENSVTCAQDCQLADTDGDGVFDTVDACPLESGKGTTDGCPEGDEKSLVEKLIVPAGALIAGLAVLGTGTWLVKRRSTKAK